GFSRINTRQLLSCFVVNIQILALGSAECQAYIKLLIIDEKPQFGIYNIELNFTTYESMRLLYGKDYKLTFPVIDDY
ncbi:MAG: hypothetical protein JW874_01730, partial [Spirochaetales bacterium]|nr:hypothetical protein [Spirochaetales bacterium]